MSIQKSKEGHQVFVVRNKFNWTTRCTFYRKVNRMQEYSSVIPFFAVCVGDGSGVLKSIIEMK